MKTFLEMETEYIYEADLNTFGQGGDGAEEVQGQSSDVDSGKNLIKLN